MVVGARAAPLARWRSSTQRAGSLSGYARQRPSSSRRGDECRVCCHRGTKPDTRSLDERQRATEASRRAAHRSLPSLDDAVRAAQRRKRQRTSTSTHRADHPRQRSTTTAMTSPRRRRRHVLRVLRDQRGQRRLVLLAARRARPRRRPRGPTTARPSPPRSGRRAGSPTGGRGRCPGAAARVVALGLASTAVHRRSPCTAKQQATTCGRPSGRTVARRPTRAAARRARQRASSISGGARRARRSAPGAAASRRRRPAGA